jgi:hypothetical protein
MCVEDGIPFVIQCAACLERFQRQHAKLVVGFTGTVCPDCAALFNKLNLTNSFDLGGKPVKH